MDKNKELLQEKRVRGHSSCQWSGVTTATITTKKAVRPGANRELRRRAWPDRGATKA